MNKTSSSVTKTLVKGFKDSDYVNKYLVQIWVTGLQVSLQNFIFHKNIKFTKITFTFH